jgi:circadian clock protein KaiB
MAPSNPGREHPLDAVPATPEWVFRLYISSASPISSRAIVNARRWLDAHLPGRYQLTILNISDHVAQAREDQIVASPTLVRVQPLPLHRLIGDLSHDARLKSVLGLPNAMEQP